MHYLRISPCALLFAITAATRITDFVIFGEEIPPDNYTTPIHNSTVKRPPISQGLYIAMATSSTTFKPANNIVLIDLPGASHVACDAICVVC